MSKPTQPFEVRSPNGAKIKVYGETYGVDGEIYYFKKDSFGNYSLSVFPTHRYEEVLSVEVGDVRRWKDFTMNAGEKVTVIFVEPSNVYYQEDGGLFLSDPYPIQDFIKHTEAV